MPPLLLDGRGNAISLGAELGRGGEGYVCEVLGRPNLVAKIYHQAVGPGRAEKLRAMAETATRYPALLKVAAWPTEVLGSRDGNSVAGFLMPRISGPREIHLLVNTGNRRVHFPSANWAFLVAAARNVAAAFETLHAAGHVMGDVNERNVFVSPADATVRLVDCDSFQIKSGTRLLRCEVGTPLFTPPELQGVAFANTDRTPDHDRFGMAVLLFQLLFLGWHPFLGLYTGSGEMDPERAIRESRFAYGPGAAGRQMKPPPLALPFEFLPCDLRRLFEEAFSSSASRAGRPSAASWRERLELLLRTLHTCDADPAHRFPANHGTCPWCAFESRGGPVYFLVTGPGNDTFVCSAEEVAAILAAFQHLPAFDDTPPGPAPWESPPEVPAAAPLPRGVRIAEVLLALGCVAIAAAVWTGLAIPGVSGLTLGIGGLLTVGFSLPLWLVGRREPVRLRTEARHQADGAASAADAETKEWAEAVASLTARHRDAGSEVEALRRALVGLQGEFEAERAKMFRNRESLQERAFLEQYLVADGGIAGIGPARAATLKYHGIETAYDVLHKNPQHVRGFGPALAGALKGWARSCKARFRYDPKQDATGPVLRALVSRFRHRKAQLTSRLKQVVSAYVAEHAASASRLARLRNQAEFKRRERAWAEAVFVSAQAGTRGRFQPVFWVVVAAAFVFGLVGHFVS